MNGLPEGFEEVVPLPDGFEEVGATKAPSSTGMYTDANNSLLESVQGGWDVAANLMAGGVGQAVSGVGLLAQTPFLGLGEAVKRHESRMENTFSAKPTSEKGKEYNEWVSKQFEGILNQAPKVVGLIPGIGDKLDENQKEFVGRVAGETALNFIPLHAGKSVATRTPKKPISPSPRLSALDKIVEEKQAAKQPEVMYVSGKDSTNKGMRAGQASPELPKKIETDPEVLQEYRLKQQEELEAFAKEAELRDTALPGENYDLFRRAEGEQIPFEFEFPREERVNPKFVEQLDETKQQLAEAVSQGKMTAEQAKDILNKVADLEDRVVPRNQRGALDIKEISDGFEAILDGRKVGYLKDNLPRGLAKELDENANIDIVKVDKEVRGKGVGRALYQAFHDKHEGRIAPSGKTTQDAWNVWKRNYPEKVDGFVKQEAQRLRSGASRELVLGNITDPEVRQRVATEAAFKVPSSQRGAIDLGGDPRMQDLLRKLSRKESLNTREQALVNSLNKHDDLLGFDTPLEALKFMYNEPTGDWNVSPTTKTAISMLSNGVKVPRSQRGGINAKDIGDSLKTLAAAVTPNTLKNAIRTAVPKEAGEVVSKIPGLQKPLKNYIPEDPSPDVIISEALKEKDSGIRFNSVQSGATLTAAKTGSSIIKGIGRLFQNGTKRAELAQREIVQPVEKLFRGLNKNEIFELGEVLKKEMFQGEQFSKAELERAGFSPKQVEVYDAFREMQNKIYEAQNAALVSEGRKPLTKREAYLSSRWQGEWRVPVYEENKLVWYIAEKSKLRAEKALEYLKKNGVNVNTKLSKVEYQGGGKNRGSIEDAYQTLLKILDPEDPRVASIKSIAEEMMANESHVALGQSKHFENKANVRGFVGDRPWKDPTSDAFEMFKEQFSYAKNALQWTELQKATKASKQILSNKELIDLQPNNLEYARQYAKNQLGFGENQYIAGLEKQLTEMTSRWLPADRRSFYDALGGAKTFFLATKLGFNTGYALANLVQPVWSAAWHTDLSAKGFKHNPLKTFANAELDASAGFLEHYFNRGEQMMTPVGKEALKYAEANGIVNRSIYDEAQGLGRNKALETAETAASASIAGVEHYARLKAFMGFVHHLDQSKAFPDKLKMFEKAEELTNIAMTDYRRGERPMVFEKGGLVGSALSTLQTFKFNYYNQLHYFSQQASKGNWKPLVAFFGIQASMGGILSMPFLQEIDDAWQTIKGWLPDSAHEPVKDLSVKKKMVETMPDWATFGGMSKLTGANMSSRFDSGNLADFSFDGLFPFISDLYKQGSAVAGFAASPNETTFAQMAYRVAPPGPIQGAVETNMIGNQNPNRLMEHDADYVRTPKQETYRKFGLRELEEGKYRDQRYRQIQNEKQIKERMEKQSDKFYDAIVRRDLTEARIYAKRYVAYGGNPDNLDAIIEREAVKQRIPREVLDRMKANTIGAVQQTNRMRNATN